MTKTTNPKPRRVGRVVTDKPRKRMPLQFTQHGIGRGIRAMVKEGTPLSDIEVETTLTGAIIRSTRRLDESGPASNKNPWDEVLKT
jgi:hypothetical protein